MARASAAAIPSELLDPAVAARSAGLRYVSDKRPGIARRKRGARFRYRAPDGKTVRDPATLARIRALAVPPAWTEVWICALPDGHIQATGRDARGRKQYRYHARFRQLRDETKYHKVLDFVAALPRIRERCRRDLALPGLPRDKVLATVVCLLEQTLIRVGNEEYSRDNQSFGLTTLRDRHARIRGAEVKFRFRGKSGKEHNVSLQDERLARIVKRCRDLPGDELFQYLDEGGEPRSIDSSDVNAYLRAITSDDFSAKDFRTWAGTLSIAVLLHELGPGPTQRAAKRHVKQAIARTAERLGNTPSVCRKCYVHPLILEAYLAGQVVPRLASGAARVHARLRADERAVVGFLKRLIQQAEKDKQRGTLGQLLRRSLKAARRLPLPSHKRRAKRPG